MVQPEDVLPFNPKMGCVLHPSICLNIWSKKKNLVDSHFPCVSSQKPTTSACAVLAVDLGVLSGSPSCAKVKNVQLRGSHGFQPAKTEKIQWITRIGLWGWVKTLVPSEPQNSWDLWMFIPLKMVLIGIDP